MSKTQFWLMCRPEECNFIKRDTPTHVFSYELLKIFKNTIFYRTAPVVVFILLFKNTISAKIYFPDFFQWEKLSEKTSAGSHRTAIVIALLRWLPDKLSGSSFFFSYLLVRIAFCTFNHEVVHDSIHSFILKQPADVSVAKGGLRNFVKFTGKHLYLQLY